MGVLGGETIPQKKSKKHIATAKKTPFLSDLKHGNQTNEEGLVILKSLVIHLGCNGMPGSVWLRPDLSP